MSIQFKDNSIKQNLYCYHILSPGEPEADYPIFNTVPETSFSCADHGDGIYADPEARCQAWHQGQIQFNRAKTANAADIKISDFRFTFILKIYKMSHAFKPSVAY